MTYINHDDCLFRQANGVSGVMADKKRILIYGDSNSWGYLDDGSGIRSADAWPHIMAQRLHDDAKIDCHIIEEVLPGRTSAYPDPQEGPEFNGLPYLRPALLSAAPIDMVLIMLGTNDYKARFEASADNIADNLIQLVKIARRSQTGKGKWREGSAPLVGLISPAILGEKTTDPSWIRHQEWIGGFDKSQQLYPALFQRISALDDEGVFLLNAADIITPSSRDPIHWAQAEHLKMGDYIAKSIAPILTSIG